MDWIRAKGHFDEIHKRYLDLIGVPGVNVTFALMMTFSPLLERYNKGERSQDLYDAMISVE